MEQLDLFRVKASYGGPGRIYFHYQQWEEHQNGMWRKIHGVEFERCSLAAAELMRDISQFTAAMRRAIIEWPNSCRMNFSANMNKLAWLGHAGCCIAVGSPEESTRYGWHMLDSRQQDLANRAAEGVLKEWESRKNA